MFEKKLFNKIRKLFGGRQFSLDRMGGINMGLGYYIHEIIKLQSQGRRNRMLFLISLTYPPDGIEELNEETDETIKLEIERRLFDFLQNNILYDIKQRITPYFGNQYILLKRYE